MFWTLFYYLYTAKIMQLPLSVVIINLQLQECP